MIDDPYHDFRREDMILRDWLALDRTVLANKRTFLAYARTAIAMAVLGIAFIKLIGHQFFEISGFVLVSLGLFVFFYGLREYATNHRRFKTLVEKERAFEAHLRQAEADEAAHQTATTS